MPTALIATTEFAQLGATERVGLGISALPITVVPHPIGNLAPEELATRAEAAMPGIVHSLTTPVDRLAAEERERTYPEPKSQFRSKTIFT